MLRPRADWRWLPLTLLVAWPAGCGGSRTAPMRAAVLPLDGIGLQEREVAAMRVTIAREIARADRVEVIDSARVDRALSPACEGAEQAVRCAARVGRQVAASHVVLGAMGGLGKTYVLQLRLVEVGKQAVTRSLEETVFGSVRDRRAAVAQIARRLVDVRPSAWYQRWWVWAIAGAVVSAAVIVPLAVRQDDPYRDIQLP